MIRWGVLLTEAPQCEWRVDLIYTPAVFKTAEKIQNSSLCVVRVQVDTKQVCRRPLLPRNRMTSGLLPLKAWISGFPGCAVNHYPSQLPPLTSPESPSNSSRWAALHHVRLRWPTAKEQPTHLYMGNSSTECRLLAWQLPESIGRNSTGGMWDSAAVKPTLQVTEIKHPSTTDSSSFSASLPSSRVKT